MVEIQTRKRQVNECERAHAALSKVTACFQQMATSLGSNIDGSFLREELEETRIVAHKICSGKTGEVETKRQAEEVLKKIKRNQFSDASGAEISHSPFSIFLHISWPYSITQHSNCRELT